MVSNELVSIVIEPCVPLSHF